MPTVENMMVTSPARGPLTLYSWVLLLFIIAIFGQAVADTDPQEIQALLAVKQHLIDTNGSLATWITTTDPCDDSWLGVFCTEEDYPSSSLPSSFSHVTELSLVSLNLSGALVEDIGNLTALKHLNVMGNQLSGSIPRSLGTLSNLESFLLSDNRFQGNLPAQLGNLVNLVQLFIDRNQISGHIPMTFGKLSKVQLLFMNNNSLTGNIPPELGQLPNLQSISLANNMLTGKLPPELAKAPSILNIQLDNNPFDAAQIPEQSPRLSALSLRNCSLQGNIPDLSKFTNLTMLDLSHNNLSGSIPTTSLSSRIRSIILSFNNLSGHIPDSFGSLPKLKYLLLNNNNLTGYIPVTLGTGPSFTDNLNPVVLDFQHNSLELANGSNLVTLQSNRSVELFLFGNPSACSGPTDSSPLCVPTQVAIGIPVDNNTSSTPCSPCQSPFILVLKTDPNNCHCAVPIGVTCRLKSPGFVIFGPYQDAFRAYISQGLNISEDQVHISGYSNETAGPGITISLQLFPANPLEYFNGTEMKRLQTDFASWPLHNYSNFGPMEFVGSTVEAPNAEPSRRGLSRAAIDGIFAAIFGLVAMQVAIFVCCCLYRHRWEAFASRKLLPTPGNKDGMPKFTIYTFKELVQATDNFSDKNIVGKGGYGTVYLGALEDGEFVAVKRAKEKFRQGGDELENEIRMLSRVHHRNLVSMLGYCNDEGEQLLVYEYVSNGTLRDHLKETSKSPLNIKARLQIAVGSARAIHYLHTQADPPIFHRDIKASNILLDDWYNGKVADFGLSKVGPREVDIDGANTGHVSTLVKGTPGYIDPQYMWTRKLTDKSDVFSFGVVLLELITGMQPISKGKNLVRMAQLVFAEAGGLKEIVDSRLGAYPADIVEPLARLALSCCEFHREDRPTMSDVLHELEEIWRETPWSDVKCQRPQSSV